MDGWDWREQGILQLPSGRLVRGRGLSRPLGERVEPEFGVYLLAKPSAPFAWESRWVQWRDFGLPRDRTDFDRVVHEAWRRASTKRVEVACGGGRGRTGTMLACMAILDGVPSHLAVDWVRQRYDERAVETRRQRLFVADYRVR